jgi:signal transduction histidine kinase
VDFVTKPFNRQELLARVAIHLELKQSREELQKTIHDKDKFFSIIAHDLRGPLGSFMSISDYVAENLEDLNLDEIRPLFREMQQTGKGVYSLLENLLEWSRIQLGTVAYHPETVDLAALVERTQTLLRVQAEQKDIDLRAGLEAIDVRCDKNMIATVLRNLVSNAIKYTPRGGRISVTVIPRPSLKLAYISVQDSGVGMDAQRVRTLFDIAQTKSTPGTDKEKGSGLGLILCRELVHLHGQEMFVESAPGEGSTFTFTLELAAEESTGKGSSGAPTTD